MKATTFILIALTLLSSCKNEQAEENKATVTTNAQLFYNGDIITMNGDDAQYAEAVVADNGKIVFVGTLNQAEANFKNSTKIDLDGKTLLPGFIDPHSHFGMVSNKNIKKIKIFLTANGFSDGDMTIPNY